MKWNPWARPFATRLVFDGVERPVQIARLSVSQQANFRIGLTRLMGGRGTAIGTDLTDEEQQRLAGLSDACRFAADRGLAGDPAEGDRELLTQLREAGAAVRRLVADRVRLEAALTDADLARQAQRDLWDAAQARLNDVQGDWLNDTVAAYLRPAEPWESAEGLRIETVEDLLQVYQQDDVLTACVLAIWTHNTVSSALRKNLPSPSALQRSLAEGTEARTGDAPASIAASAALSASAPSVAATDVCDETPVAV